MDGRGHVRWVMVGREGGLEDHDGAIFLDAWHNTDDMDGYMTGYPRICYDFLFAIQSCIWLSEAFSKFPDVAAILLSSSVAEFIQAYGPLSPI